MVWDLEGRIIAWNPAAKRMYGWSEEEALKMNLHDLMPDNLRDEATGFLKKLSVEKLLEPFRTKRVTQDKRTVEVWLTVSPLVNQIGRVYAVAATEREIIPNKP